MLFNSFIFILVFLPICITGYFTLNHFQKINAAKAFLVGMSLWFYGYFNVSYLAVIIASVLVNFFFYRLIVKNQDNNSTSKLYLILALIFNIGMLGVFKYTDFFLSTVNSIFKTDIPLLHILLPLGISFFTFQQISFVVDAYRGEVEDYKFLDYACFVTYFPQLIAGPIVTHDELVPQLDDPEKKQINWNNIGMGLYMFAMGLVKKAVIADTLGNAVNYGYSFLNSMNSTNLFIIIISYTMQIYFDFSGYCDMAIGIGKMMNIDLPVNFNSPYKATTIEEFWDRWHMTLTRFFTKYVYIPLGGNRKGNIRTYVNVFIVFFLSGLWHGAGYTFILWGIGHGLLMIITRRFRSAFKKIPKAIGWFITFAYVNLLWVFFRANTIADAVYVIKNAFSFKFGAIDSEIYAAFRIPEMSLLGKVLGYDFISTYLTVPIFILISICISVFAKNSYERMNKYHSCMKYAILSAFLLIWGICSLSGVSTFLYFNF